MRAGCGVGVVDDAVVRKLQPEPARAVFVCGADADHSISCATVVRGDDEGENVQAQLASAEKSQTMA